jgi:hypothetical protein
MKHLKKTGIWVFSFWTETRHTRSHGICWRWSCYYCAIIDRHFRLQTARCTASRRQAESANLLPVGEHRCVCCIPSDAIELRVLVPTGIDSRLHQRSSGQPVSPSLAQASRLRRRVSPIFIRHSLLPCLSVIFILAAINICNSFTWLSLRASTSHRLLWNYTAEDNGVPSSIQFNIIPWMCIALHPRNLQSQYCINYFVHSTDPAHYSLLNYVIPIFLPLIYQVTSVSKMTAAKQAGFDDHSYSRHFIVPSLEPEYLCSWTLPIQACRCPRSNLEGEDRYIVTCMGLHSHTHRKCCI